MYSVFLICEYKSSLTIKTFKLRPLNRISDVYRDINNRRNAVDSPYDDKLQV
jgi:hypothetical protein